MPGPDGYGKCCMAEAMPAHLSWSCGEGNSGVAPYISGSGVAPSVITSGGSLELKEEDGTCREIVDGGNSSGNCSHSDNNRGGGKMLPSSSTSGRKYCSEDVWSKSFQCGGGVSLDVATV
eukprot:14334502-Ditylum_brightwellii.AAC.1